MSIVSSTYVQDAHAQVDGSHYVVERHTDSTGRVHQFLWLAATGFDVAARVAARAISLATELADAEASEVVNG